MFTLRFSRSLGLVSMLLATMLVLPARAQEPRPIKVAIVGLEHGHVEGFLAQLPKHSDVQLVGIADADPTLWQKYA